MNKIWIWIIVVVAAIGLFVGTYFLYDYLTDTYMADKELPVLNLPNAQTGNTQSPETNTQEGNQESTQNTPNNNENTQEGNQESTQNSPNNNENTQEEPNPEYAAPDFTVYDKNGNPVKLSQLRGKPVVLNMWASWCGPCKSEMPGFQAMYEKYGEDVHFMMNNLTTQDNLGDAQELISRNGYTFPVYFDKDNSTAASYSTGSIPMSFFINSKGELVTYAIGAIDEATLEKAIGMIQ